MNPPPRPQPQHPLSTGPAIAWGLLLATFGLSLDASASDAVEGPQAQRAKAMVASAIRYMDRHGSIALVQKINHHAAPEFRDGAAYAFILDHAGRIVAHPLSLDALGRSADDVLDLDGRPHRRKMSAQAGVHPSGSWFSYRWRHPVTGRPSHKTSWLREHDGLIIGVWIYPD